MTLTHPDDDTTTSLSPLVHRSSFKNFKLAWISKSEKVVILIHNHRCGCQALLRRSYPQIKQDFNQRGKGAPAALHGRCSQRPPDLAWCWKSARSVFCCCSCSRQLRSVSTSHTATQPYTSLFDTRYRNRVNNNLEPTCSFSLVNKVSCCLTHINL